MRWCPRCNKYVETTIHNYFSKKETRIEYVCNRCGQIIEVSHFPRTNRWEATPSIRWMKG